MTRKIEKMARKKAASKAVTADLSGGKVRHTARGLT